ncbi:class I SAM-dependent DNA methyltransferase [Lacticaseibacillus paracasei]|uniref:class I SAM-dependent DNA methyltransferase n=1 Tax=Lacticaseibacillus paracasei TaxID=1597 RepID=UPI002A5A0F2D|nr:DNA methyltransferase [Lacticaseibacillus paracasei]MDY0838713.1 DNA methyltransferase [Lacticaseibacillus paracasei]
MAITEYEDQIQEIVSKADHSKFIYDFLSVYDIPRATVTKLRKGMNNLAKEASAVYLKNKLYFKEGNGDLMQDFADLQERVDELGSKPRYLLVTDYQDLLAKDTKTNETLDIEFAKLPQYFDFFLAWNGIEKADFDKENPADVRAAERFAKLYDVVVKDNPEATRKGLNLFLIRILFCLFAEDTNIFEHDLFTNRVKQMTADDGSNFDQFISSLFGVLDFEKSQRPVDTPSWLNDFPYVDGDLFKDQHESLHFSAKARKLIIEAGELLKWDQINPDILGSMIQAVASEDSRSHLGMHYTSVPNIMKVIKPLFLDGLRGDFEAAKGNENKLQQLYDRIGKIKFMDPACGSGNFLIITYKELRQLEIDILIELNNIGVSTMYVPSVTLAQFYGIEIDDFACDVTRLSLWIAEHQMNVKLHEQISDAVRPTLPLQHAGDVLNENALKTNWNAVVPHGNDDEVYLFGNPPYLGSAMQNKVQKKELASLVGDDISAYSCLDYIAGWFYLGAKYIGDTKAAFAFVTTNSISQGEQVAPLWTFLRDRVQVSFAYQSFPWENNAKNNAGVIVAIIGFVSRKIDLKSKTLFDNNGFSKTVTNISPYLSEGSDSVVVKQNHPINGLPPMMKGSQPTDGGGLIFSRDEMQQAISENAELSKYFRTFIGSKEYMDSEPRFVLWLNQEQYLEIKNDPVVEQRMNVVVKARLSSKNKTVNKLANSPWRFQHIAPNFSAGREIKGSLIVPRVTSQNRLYVPMGIVDDETIVSDNAMYVYDAPIWLLGILESRMHMCWIKAVGGRLKNDFRYSAGLIYNTFPMPELSVRRKNEIGNLVMDLIDIREEEEGSISDLYGAPLAGKNPKPMNDRLLKIHQNIDTVVDRAYRADEFREDSQRLSMLLKMYEEKVKTIGQ